MHRRSRGSADPRRAPPPNSHATGSPEDTIRQHDARIDAKRYADGYALIDAHLRRLNSPADYASWFASKVSITPLAIDLVSHTDDQAVVGAVVRTTDRIGGQEVTTQVSEEFVLRRRTGVAARAGPGCATHWRAAAGAHRSRAALALNWAGQLATVNGEPDDRVLLEQRVGMAERLGDLPLLARGLRHLGVATKQQGNEVAAPPPSRPGRAQPGPPGGRPARGGAHAGLARRATPRWPSWPTRRWLWRAPRRQRAGVLLGGIPEIAGYPPNPTGFTDGSLG